MGNLTMIDWKEQGLKDGLRGIHCPPKGKWERRLYELGWHESSRGAVRSPVKVGDDA